MNNRREKRTKRNKSKKKKNKKRKHKKIHKKKKNKKTRKKKPHFHLTLSIGKYKEDIFKNYSTVGSIAPDQFENVQFRSGSADSIVYLEWPGRGTGWEGSYAQLLR